MGREESSEIHQRQMQVLNLGKNKLLHQHRLGADLLGSSFVEKDLWLCMLKASSENGRGDIKSRVSVVTDPDIFMFR